MSKKQTHTCEKCQFEAKTIGGLKSHQRAKHGMGSGRGVKFDLNIDSQAKADELVEHMNILISTSGWLLLKQIMLGNIAILEEAIIDCKDPETGAKLTEDELGDARKTRAVMKEMVEKPEKLIEQFKRQAASQLPTYDPYAVDVRQFSESSRYGQPRAGTLKTE